MPIHRAPQVLVVCVLFLAILTLADTSMAYGETQSGAEQLTELKTYTSEQLKAALATLSDKEVRAVLLAELEQEAEAAGKKKDQSARKTGIAGVMAHLEKVFEMAPQRFRAMAKGLGRLPAEIGKFVDQVTHGKGVGRFILLLLSIAVIIGAGYGLERLLRKSMLQFGEKSAEIPLPESTGRAGDALMTALPPLVGIIVFTVVSALLCLIFLGGEASIRHVYGPILIAIVAIRVLMLAAQILCAPRHKERRLVSVDDNGARALNRTLNLIFIVLVVAWITTQWFKRIGIPNDSFLLVTFGFATFFIVMLGWIVWTNRTPVAQHIIGADDDKAPPQNQLRVRFANLWHILALAYLLWMWFALVSRLIVYGPNFGQAFLRSLAVVPLYLIIDRLLSWAVPAVLGATTDDQDEPAEEDDKEEDETPVPVRTLRTRLPVFQAVVRGVIVLALLVWVLEAYNIHMPFMAKIAGGGFDILVTIVLALVAWRWLNSYVARKLEETAPPPSDEPADEEFGGVVLDRSHTLLPMLRKFIGTVLLIMVVMIVLSSLGIDIGPLLAGAGVVGLAVGFGAQKLVSDVLSGFFFLMDDAFRVGEYIQAGSVSGTVEAITLRNVMMRHPRGALQIVPFSELGTISNLMRGGMVIKFNIDLPYDTDIEKVRKIIKKVGKKMLQDPAMKDDFILPVKSQGVKSMGDSVMTFRVKFTAKPGKQFLIKREAFRRIKEALEAKGIYYAHRKVIVELPENATDETSKDAAAKTEQKEQLLKAGAAATETILNEEEAKSKKNKR